MRDRKSPFRLNLESIWQRFRRLPVLVDGVALRLPFLNLNVRANDTERKTAREIVIRLADRRVLNSSECCDGCIDRALASLQEVRSLLVDKQVELSDHIDGPLYLLLEVMLEAIRQFFTFEQQLDRSSESRPFYFAALEMLRGHLYRCLWQVATIADIEMLKIPENMRYDDKWQIEAYEPPQLPEARSDLSGAG